MSTEDYFGEKAVEPPYMVRVDIEDVLYDTKEANARMATDFIDYRGEDIRVYPSDFDDWSGDSTAARKVASVTGWEDHADSFMNGASQEWGGFHVNSDIAWTGRTDAYSWMEEEYPVEFTEKTVPEDLARLFSMPHTDVDIMTTRGNWFSGFDVETALRQRLLEDLADTVPANYEDLGSRIKFEKDSKLDRKPRPDVVIDDSPSRAEKAADRDDVVVLVPETPQNNDYSFEGRVSGFSEAVDVVERLGGES